MNVNVDLKIMETYADTDDDAGMDINDGIEVELSERSSDEMEIE